MSVSCPPPHMVLHEPLDDKSTRIVWKNYTTLYANEVESSELDAAETCSVDDFSREFEVWVTSKSSKRIKLLIVWHAHFLSLACQQTLRRWLETKSYRCRVWFHVEQLNYVQNAILSRCILSFIDGIKHTIPTVIVEGPIPPWKKITNENELRDLATTYTICSVSTQMAPV